MKTYRVTVDRCNTIRWYNEDNQTHREGGPAVELSNGNKFWYFKGKLHREDGPAVEWANGTKYWRVHGKLHREDGPAVVTFNSCGTMSHERWYLEGESLNEEQFKVKMRSRKCINQTITIEGRDYILIPKNDAAARG